MRLLLTALTAALAAASAAGGDSTGVDLYFAPYDSDSNLQADLSLLQQVTAAAAADPASGSYPLGQSPYQIKYAVYNLLDEDYLNATIAAWQAGAEVQVLIHYAQLQQPYVPTWQMFKDAGMKVAPLNATQRTLPAAVLPRLNLVGIDTGGLMHAKTRFYSWGAGKGEQKLLTGSLNPEDTGLMNDETLVHVTDTALMDQYLEFYNATLYSAAGANTYNNESAVNAFYSQWGGEIVREVILDMVEQEDEFIAVWVYALRNLQGAEADWTDALVDRLCAAQARGVPTVVLTDKGEADGEANFTTGDAFATAFKLAECGVVTYKCRNAGGNYTAFHHKNGMFGLNKRVRFVTDTANWSGASMGYGPMDDAAARTLPTNVETTMVIDSTALDGGLSGRRMLSNVLYSLRTYGYQQQCPYLTPDGVEVDDQCADEEPYNQTSWSQPGFAEVLDTVLVPGPAAWPQVTVGLRVAGGANGVLNGTYIGTQQLDDEGYVQVEGVPMGAVLELNLVGSDRVHQRVVDPARNWELGQRRTDEELGGMSVEFVL